MRFRPRRVSARRAGTDEQWRVVGVLSAAEDMRLHETMPDDTRRVFDLCREHVVTVRFTDVNREVLRALAGIPAGFPLWFRPERLALPAPRVRAALPWGDTCYTTAVYAQVAGWPRMMWGMGPVTGFTPSGEGPRC